MRKSPLECWIAEKIGIGEGSITREQLNAYHLQKLRETISWAYTRSPFYRSWPKELMETDLACLADLERLPFTTGNDIRENGLRFLAVSQGDISRVVTLESSGTTGRAKRVYFTPADQELTIDFFQHGMAALAAKGERALILLPGERPGSVGDLLASALVRLGAEPIPHGVVRNALDTLTVIEREKVDCLVGIPVQVLALSRYAGQAAKSCRLKNVLLSTDHVPDAIVREIKRVFGCEVFEHFGMTELGLGGGTACAAHTGYHLHEADFYFEIVNPVTGAVVPAGQEGEVVVTTLTRLGMPLIRYRTGDISRFLPEPCGCGAVIRRLDRITRRQDSGVWLNGDQNVTMAALDEALFAVDRVTGFTAAVDRIEQASRLLIDVAMTGQADEALQRRCQEALDTIPAIRQARISGKLTVMVKTVSCAGILLPTTAKRTITELSEANGKSDNISSTAWEDSTAG